MVAGRCFAERFASDAVAIVEEGTPEV